MVVVIALTNRNEANKRIVCGMQLVVVGSVAEHVCPRVHEEGRMNVGHVARHEDNNKSVPPAFLRDPLRHDHRHHQRTEEVALMVVLVLKPDYRVRHEVRDIEPRGLDVTERMFFNTNPADMRETEAPLDVMRIRIGITVLVVQPMA